jgi:hypothetical protein
MVQSGMIESTDSGESLTARKRPVIRASSPRYDSTGLAIPGHRPQDTWSDWHLGTGVYVRGVLCPARITLPHRLDGVSALATRALIGIEHRPRHIAAMLIANDPRMSAVG